jgi:hypothetical protein
MEVKMIITLDKEQGNGGLKQIKVEGGREKEEEVIVRHKIVSSKWKTWNYDNFSRDWNKNYSV